MKKRKRGLVVTVRSHGACPSWIVMAPTTSPTNYVNVCRRYFERALGGKAKEGAKYRITVTKEGA